MQVAGQHGLSLLRLMATGARVRNTYTTYLQLGDNLEKFGLISHSKQKRHLFCFKDLLIGDGYA